MTKRTFFTLKQRTVEYREPFTESQFIELIKEHKPVELFNGQWSKDKPLLVIDKYFDTGVSVYSNVYVDKTPRLMSYEALYSYVKLNGLLDFHYKK